MKRQHPIASLVSIITLVAVFAFSTTAQVLTVAGKSLEVNIPKNQNSQVSGDDQNTLPETQSSDNQSDQDNSKSSTGSDFFLSQPTTTPASPATLSSPIPVLLVNSPVNHQIEKWQAPPAAAFYDYYFEVVLENIISPNAP